MRFLFILFIVIPLAEMLLLFEVSDQIGGFYTLALVVATAVIGVQILKRQGLSTLLRANQRLQSGQLPAQEIVEGMMLAGAGALLLTPGFITDTLGFLFLTGPVRRAIAGRIINSGLVKTMGRGPVGGGFSAWSSSSSAGRTGGPSSEHSSVFEGEFSEEGGTISQGSKRASNDPEIGNKESD